MRIKNMYFICKKNLAIINNIRFIENKLNNGQINRTVTNYDEVQQTLSELYRIDCFKKAIDELLGICTSFHRSNTFYIYNDDYGKFTIKLEYLINRVKTIIDLGNSLGFQECEYGFDIKMPPEISLADLGLCINDINKALEQCPYLHETDEKIEFQSVDIGSTWLTFITASPIAGSLLIALAKIVDKAVQIASHIFSVKQQQEQLRTLELGNDILENNITINKTITKALLEKCSQELQQDIHTLTPDDNERLKYTLDNLSKWMSKGMEIYSCIEAPSEIQNLFPTQVQQKALAFNKKELPKNEMHTDTEE